MNLFRNFGTVGLLTLLVTFTAFSPSTRPSASQGTGPLLSPTDFVTLTQEHAGQGGNENGDEFGAALAAGDFNGDGYMDLAIGAPGEAPVNDPKSGAVFVNAGLRASPTLTHGGLLGAVTDTSIKIWARADRPAMLSVQYKLPSESWPGITSPGVSLATTEDFTGVVTLTGLMPNTTYDYRLLLDDMIQPGSEATFRTLKAQGVRGTFTFAIGADTRFGSDPYPIFDRIRERNPDFMILMGDQIYGDSPVLIEDTKAAYERKYKENWAEAHLREFMKRIPMFMIWDDHEIINNWDQGQVGRYLNAKAAYDEYQGSHNPPPRAPGQNYYSFSVGQVDFYVLDTRSFRHVNSDPDNAAKTMLGAAQKADLKSWLSDSTAKFKLIVSSVPWSNFANTGNNSWEGFQLVHV
ncbi:MAG: alkaline phosphatase D family protein [Acidobacteria bacterium]|nr:alkaline phosphatase D family protein [Acidobacteriota bacterium]